MKLRVFGIETEYVESMRSAGKDANGQSAITRIAEGIANPCRHCLDLINEGDPMLILAHRPFVELQPYAEVGPIFLHEKTCEHYDSEQLPDWFSFIDPAIIRGYGKDNWIRYETGNVIQGTQLRETCENILNDETIEYVHIRSKFNCFQCRVERARNYL